MQPICRWAVVFVIVLALPSLASKARAARSDNDLLQGAWVCVATKKDGQAVNDYVGVRAVIAGGSLHTWLFPQKDGVYREQKCKFRIDPAKNPKHFDWWSTEKPDSIDQRIYAVDEKTLRWSTNLDRITRPADFAAGRWQFTMNRLASPAPPATAKQRTASDIEVAGWGRIFDPDGDCTIRADGSKLTIEVPGTKHDLFFGGPDVAQRFNAPRVLRVVDGDFVARVQVSGDWKLVPEGSYNGAGLLLWDSEGQYLRLERNKYYRTTEPRGPHSYISPLYDHNQKRAEGFKTSSKDFFAGPATWLRIERAGKQITTSISNDGSTWTQTGKLATEFRRQVSVGVFVINTSPRPFTAQFADFKVLKE